MNGGRKPWESEFAEALMSDAQSSEFAIPETTWRIPAPVRPIALGELRTRTLSEHQRQERRRARRARVVSALLLAACAVVWVAMGFVVGVEVAR